MLDVLTIDWKLWFIPVVGVGLIIVYLIVFYPDHAFRLTLFCIPFSFDLTWGTNFSFDFPAEPLMLGMVLFHGWGFWKKKFLPAKFWNHPLSWAVILYWHLAGFLVFTSTIPFISFKRWLMLSLYLLFAYFLAAKYMSSIPRIRSYFLWLGSGLTGVLLIVYFRHAAFGFVSSVAPAMGRPFFDDHTVLGAAIAFFLVLFVDLVKWRKRDSLLSFFCLENMLLILAVLALALGLFLTFSRGAWLSLLFALPMGLAIWFRLSWKRIVPLLGLLVVAIFLARVPLVEWMKKNEAQSLSSGWGDHLLSSFNFMNHDSNLERRNRWICAWDMTGERPILGWGPATYAFQYGKFQQVEHMTRISTWRGDRGNAHSEYIGHLAEGGWLWAGSFLAIWITSLWCGFDYMNQSREASDKRLMIVILTALFTYMLHGLVNSFLDQIELAAWVFGAWAALVQLSSFQKNEHAE